MAAAQNYLIVFGRPCAAPPIDRPLVAGEPHAINDDRRQFQIRVSVDGRVRLLHAVCKLQAISGEVAASEGRAVWHDWSGFHRLTNRCDDLDHGNTSPLFEDDTAKTGGRVTDCTVRQATLADAPAIAGLMTQLGYSTSADDMARRLRVLLSHPDYATFVAETPHRIVGLVGAYVGYALELTGSYGRLTGLVVDVEWRGRGIGRALMESIERWRQPRTEIYLARPLYPCAIIWIA